MFRICKSTGETGWFDACPRVAKGFYKAVSAFGSI